MNSVGERSYPTIYDNINECIRVGNQSGLELLGHLVEADPVHAGGAEMTEEVHEMIVSRLEADILILIGHRRALKDWRHYIIPGDELHRT